MVSRTAVMIVPVALSLLISGCSNPSGDNAAQDTPTAEQSQTQTPSPGPSTKSGKGEGGSTDVKDLPDFVQPYPDATVLSSSRSKPQAKADSSKLVQVSLVQKAEAESKDILKFYTKALKKAGFESYGDEVKSKDAHVLNFRHKKNEGLLVLTISKDPAEKSTSIITIGGKVKP